MGERLLFYNTEKRNINIIFNKPIVFYEEDNKTHNVQFSISFDGEHYTLNSKIENLNYTVTKDLFEFANDKTFRISKDDTIYTFNYIDYRANESLANDIMSLIQENEIFDVCLLYNDRKISFNSDNIKISYEKPNKIFDGAIQASFNMTFEGALYHAINNNTDKILLRKFDRIFEDHNCYYELCNTWNLRVCYN